MTEVDYSSRPNKNLVRSRMWDIVETTLQPQRHPDEDISFITFSGVRFIDSIEYYKRFKARKIYSIENDERRYRRAKFNLPYEFVDLTRGEIREFIDDKFEEVIDTRKVIHLDYECSLRDSVLSDVNAVFTSQFFEKPGLLFVTFNRSFNKGGAASKIRELVPEEIESQEAYEQWLGFGSGFSEVVLHEVRRKHERSKSVREVLKVFYSDTSPMVTVGYHVSDRQEEEASFVATDVEVFKLPSLTGLEANYIHNHLGDPPERTAEILGLLEEDVERYRNLV